MTPLVVAVSTLGFIVIAMIAIITVCMIAGASSEARRRRAGLPPAGDWGNWE